MRRTTGNGRLKIMAHAHGEPGQVMRPRQTGEHLKMRHRLFMERRDAHQPLDFEMPLIPALPEKCVNLAGQKPRFLGFSPCIDLHEKPRQFLPPSRALTSARASFSSIERLDDIEESESFLKLVGLQGSDEMQIDIRVFRLESRPFADRLLHAVFVQKQRWPATR